MTGADVGRAAEHERGARQAQRPASVAPSLLDNKASGAYCCKLCGLPLFKSGTKFESGTGWPSFTAPFDEMRLKYLSDSSYWMVRTEIVYTRGGRHQGHVFDDGPPPTGYRSSSWVKAKPFPDKLGRGEARG